MRIKLGSAVLLVILLLSGLAAARLKVPEGPSGAATCSDLTDNDINNDADSGDVGCAASDALTELDATDVYAAKAVEGILSGLMTAVLDDALEPFGPDSDYIWMPPGTHPFAGQAKFSGAPAGTYEIHVLARFLSGASGELWVKADTKPFQGPPSNADADVLNNRIAVASPTWFQLGRIGDAKQFPVGIKQEPQRTLTLTSGQSVYLMLQAGLQLDCLVLRPVGNTNPVECPGGGSGGGGTADYEVQQWNTAPTVDGTEDALWAQAPALPFTGTGATVGTSVVRLLWKEGSPDRICALLKHTAANLTAAVTTEDNSMIFSDTALDLRLRFVDTMATRDADTYALVVNATTPTPAIYDKNDSGGTGNPTFDFSNRSVGASYAANVLIIEACVDIPSPGVSAGQLMLGDVGVNEKQSGIPLAYKLSHCTGTNLIDPICWGTWQLSATVIGPPPDTTAPVVGTPACTPNESGAVCVSAVTEADSFPVTCRAFRDADNDNEVTTDGSFTTTSCGNMVGSSCTCAFTGLSSPDHEMQIEAKDASGNAGVSAITDFSLVAASGDTWYMAASGGSDSNSCTSSGSRCASFAGVLAKAAFGPGDTILVGNGTYTGAGFVLNCAANAAKFNGTSALRITLKAENERQAHIIPSSALNAPLAFDNCSYWTIEGLHFKGQNSTAAGASASPASFKSSGTNIIFRYNVVEHSNQCVNSSLFRMENVTDSLVEDNEFYDHHRNAIGAGSRNIYRRNYYHSRNAATPACYAVNDTQNDSRGDAGYINYSGQTNLDMLFENNIAENVSTAFLTTGGSSHKRIKMYGNMARDATTYTFGDESRDSANRTGMLWEHNLGICAGMRSRATSEATWKNNTNIAFGSCPSGAGKGMSADATGSEFGTKNYTWSWIQNLVVGFSSASGFFLEQPISNTFTGNVLNWQRIKNNSFGNNAAYSPSAGGSGSNSAGTWNGTSSGNTSVDPELGDALICIPTSSPMHASQRADGLTIGATILYQYNSPSATQPGTLTSTRLWSTSKGAGSNCPNSVSGWYPSWLRPCIAGVNDVAGQSLYDAADRLLSRNPATATSVLNSCAGGVYQP